MKLRWWQTRLPLQCPAGVQSWKSLLLPVLSPICWWNPKGSLYLLPGVVVFPFLLVSTDPRSPNILKQVFYACRLREENLDFLPEQKRQEVDSSDGIIPGLACLDNKMSANPLSHSHLSASFFPFILPSLCLLNLAFIWFSASLTLSPPSQSYHPCPDPPSQHLLLTQ